MADLHIVIERAPEGYGAYIREVDGIVATGRTIDEIQKAISEAIAFHIEDCSDFGMEIPEPLMGDYSMSFEMDTQTLLQYYGQIFGKPALEKLTGINQKQLWHYATGKSSPRPAQRDKINQALHNLGKELLMLNI